MVWILVPGDIARQCAMTGLGEFETHIFMYFDLGVALAPSKHILNRVVIFLGLNNL